ncbi:MAG: hypothetical protein K2H32_04565 [Muribaculaceae bacterium]|nr:hypothetical protein [Muribaculaceae bacterium]MDE5857611.1 hypothetical protein [Muribaculaceae bacterium]
MKRAIYIIIALIGLGFCQQIVAEPVGSEFNPLKSMANRKKIPVDSTVVRPDGFDEKVIIGDDTVSIIIPEKNYGRYDRGLFNYLIIPKGQWAFGLTASYGEFSTDDLEMLSIITDLDFKVKAYSLRPSISYFFRNNQSIGLKFNYVRTMADLQHLSVDIDEDLSFSISNISYYSQSYSASVFYRNYVGLGASKRFAIFNEVDLTLGSGISRFKRYYNEELKDTRTNVTTGALNFSPGVCVFIMDNVSFNVSFGVFGLNFNREKQITNEVEEGTRFSSGANFRFNIFNINFGLGIHI